jgi:dihydroflavonol-4-reductase
MRALVLGANGFIGGHIVKAALDAEWSVRALRRSKDRVGVVGDAPVEWVEGDLDSPSGLVTIFQGIDVVFHAAGYYPHDSKNVSSQVAHSVQQITGVLRLMREGPVNRLVYTSSFTTMVPPLADKREVINEQDHYPPGMLARSAYYECKVAMERALLTKAAEDLSVVIMNPTMVLGPGGMPRSTQALFLAIAHGWGRVWLPARINIVDVRDVAQAHLKAAEMGQAGERYLLGGHNLELRQLMQEIAKLYRVKGPSLRLPWALIDLLVWMEDHLPGVNVFANHLRAIRFWPYVSVEKAERELDYMIRPLQETLVDMYKSYQNSGYL